MKETTLTFLGRRNKHDLFRGNSFSSEVPFNNTRVSWSIHSSADLNSKLHSLTRESKYKLALIMHNGHMKQFIANMLWIYL
jgi:hypothetical protein